MSLRQVEDGVPAGAAVPESELVQDLKALAAEKQSGKRVELLRRITELYLEQTEAHTSVERYLFDDILSKIVGQISGQHKIEVAENLSPCIPVPDGVGRALAMDEDIAVAGPLLRNALGLSETILVDAAKSGSQDHLEAIAQRSVVTPPVSDVIVDRGNSTVMHTLAGNSGARFSAEGMERLIAKAEDDLKLQALIIERPDANAEVIEKLMPFVNAGIARAQADDGEVDQDDIREYLATWLRGRKKNLEQTDSCIALINKGIVSIDEAVGHMLKNRRLLDAATIIASQINLERCHAFTLLTQNKARSALMLMRSAEMGWEVVREFLEVRREKMRLQDLDVEAARQEYEAIDSAGARRAVRFLKVRRSAKFSEDTAPLRQTAAS